MVSIDQGTRKDASWLACDGNSRNGHIFRNWKICKAFFWVAFDGLQASPKTVRLKLHITLHCTRHAPILRTSQTLGETNRHVLVGDSGAILKCRNVLWALRIVMSCTMNS
jgi:hypothetical protein